MRTPQFSWADRLAPSIAFSQPQRAEIAYRGLTVAVMVALLATLWVF